MAGWFDINAGHDALGIKLGMPVSPAGMGVAVLPVWISVYLLTIMLKQGKALNRHEPWETDRKTWQGFSPYIENIVSETVRKYNCNLVLRVIQQKSF